MAYAISTGSIIKNTKKTAALWFNFCNIILLYNISSGLAIPQNHIKMKHLKKLLPVIILFLSVTITGAQTSPLPAEVVTAVKKGDAIAIKPFLNNKVELLLPGESGVYSQEQAHFVLKSFFENNKVTSFKVLHHGTRQNATFAIGEYNCSNDEYRIYFLVKITGDKKLIHQIRIEKQD